MRMMVQTIGVALMVAVISAAVILPNRPGAAHAATETLTQNDINLINILVRNSVITLNNANRTGNYTVLRDLGTPGFQAANTAARLAEIFARLRRRNFDLAPVVLFDPTFAAPPTVDRDGRLRAAGFFPTRPQQVNFDLTFESIQGRWMVHAMSIDTAPANAALVQQPAASRKSNAPANAIGVAN